MRPKKTVPYTVPSSGALLKKYFKEKRISKAALSRKLGVDYDSILKYVKNDTIQTAILWNLCNALNHNFFMDIAVNLPKEFSTYADLYSEKDEKIKQLEQEITILKAEKDILLKVSSR